MDPAIPTNDDNHVKETTRRQDKIAIEGGNKENWGEGMSRKRVNEADDGVVTKTTSKKCKVEPRSTKTLVKGTPKEPQNNARKKLNGSKGLPSAKAIQKNSLIKTPSSPTNKPVVAALTQNSINTSKSSTAAPTNGLRQPVIKNMFPPASSVKPSPSPSLNSKASVHQLSRCLVNPTTTITSPKLTPKHNTSLPSIPPAPPKSISPRLSTLAATSRKETQESGPPPKIAVPKTKRSRRSAPPGALAAPSSCSSRPAPNHPPAPHLTVDLEEEGIKLLWTHPLPSFAQGMVQYELQGRLANSPHEDPSPWKTFSLLQAVPLPMKCVLAKKVGKTCYFRVRGISKNGAMTGWSDDVSVTVN